MWGEKREDGGVWRDCFVAAGALKGIGSSECGSSIVWTLDGERMGLREGSMLEWRGRLGLDEVGLETFWSGRGEEAELLLLVPGSHISGPSIY